MKSTADIRREFLEFFAERDHKIVRSSSLVPGNDPTLLFTNAGMVQFKDVFLGAEKRDYKRATTAQRCVRAGGKHNDLENVGYTARHHTFFEMLGNFSFGDYFKREAIEFAWEFLTVNCGFPAEKLWVTVYEDDEEAAAIWLDEIGVDPARLSRIGDKPGKRFESDNFWAMGDTGPCGPCSEIFYDHGPEVPGGPPGTPEEDGDRYIEIWNLVFMQFDRAADGRMSPLPSPCVDTGMGLERLAAVLQGVHSNYEIDLFAHLIKAAAEKTGADDLGQASLKVIADHIRACAFLVADGVLPANDGRGYVLRRIIRRAIRHGYKLGCKQPFFAAMVDPLVEVMGEAYPELVDKRDQIIDALSREEQRFGETLEQGMKLLEESILPGRMRAWATQNFGRESVGPVRLDSLGGEYDRFLGTYVNDSESRTTVEFCYAHRGGRNAVRQLRQLFVPATKRQRGDRSIFLFVSEAVGTANIDKELAEEAQRHSDVQAFFLHPDDLPQSISGELAFKLYDTFGFPLDLTRDIARERGLSVDEAGFESQMQQQRDLARRASKFESHHLDRLVISDQVDIAVQPGPTNFVGYDKTAIDDAVIRRIVANDTIVSTVDAPTECVLILNRTPFYAESGGQVGDTGLISGPHGVFKVRDTKKVGGEFFAHFGVVESGSLSVDDLVTAAIDTERRADIVRHHSATHLLHAALREILGEHVQQKGSLVAPDRLRFDFSHFEPVTPGQLREIETRVNEQIQANVAASAEEMDYDQAMDAGALAFFGDKYGDRVRVLQFGDYSTELCGGTHVDRVGDIGAFKIVHETGISAGVRRIEAVAGRRAVAWMQDTDRALRSVAERLKSSPEQVGARVEQLLDRSRELEKELDRIKQKLASARGSDLSANAKDIGGVKVLAERLEGVDPNSLRDTVDQLKNKLGSAIVVLGTEAGQGVRLVAGVTGDLTDRFKAGELVNFVAGQVGGKGGGRADFAQAGGSDAENLGAAMESVFGWVEGKS